MASDVGGEIEEIMEGLVNSHGRHNNPPDLLYHYCPAEALLPILTSGKMWASNIRFQNDPREMVYARDLVSDLMGEIKRSRCSRAMRQLLEKIDFDPLDRFLSVYVTCFSEDGDLLSQWRAYGRNGSGFSLGFDAGKISKVSDGEGLVAVEYSEKVQKSILKSTFDALEQYMEGKLRVINSSPKRKRFMAEAAQSFSVCLLFFMLIFKAKGYREEKEWRYVAIRSIDEAKDIKFRNQQHMIVPYIEINLAKVKGSLPLSEVVAGPARNQALDQMALPILLENAGLPDVALKSSVLSYRP
jgi:hypothetical protein